MPRVKKNNNIAVKPQVTVENLICGMCGTEKKVIDFYTSYNSIHKTGRLPYCKECLKDMSKDDNGNIIVEKFKDMLKMIDRPFLYDIFDVSVKAYIESKNDDNKRKTKDVIGDYFKNIGMHQYRDLGWNDSIFDNEKDTTENNQCDIIYNNNNKKTYSTQWMGEYTFTDLEYLNNYIKGLHGDFKIVTENHKDYAKK